MAESFGKALRRLRGEMSLRALAREASCSKSHISALEHGHRSPTPAVAAALDAALDADGALLATAAPSTAPASGHPLLDDPADVLDQARALLTPHADPALLDVAEMTQRSVVTRYEMLGPRPLAGEIRLLRTMLHTMLTRPQPSDTRTRILTLAARSSGLLAYMAVNLGVMDAAHAYCAEARLLAQQARDVPLQMWVLGTLAHTLYYQHRYAEADAAAQAGIELAPDNAQAIRLLINGRARALARASQRTHAERAIGQALTLSGRQHHLPDGLTPCISFEPYPPARTLANAITAHLSQPPSSRRGRRERVRGSSAVAFLVGRGEHDGATWLRRPVRLWPGRLRPTRPDVPAGLRRLVTVSPWTAVTRALRRRARRCV